MMTGDEHAIWMANKLRQQAAHQTTTPTDAERLTTAADRWEHNPTPTTPVDVTELRPDDTHPVDEWVCDAVINGDRCPNPVGWSLTEIDDTYDSGFEQPRWWPTWVTSDGGVRVCEDCSMHLEDPDLDPDSTTELAKAPTT